METKYIKIDASNIDHSLIHEAGRILKNGGLVAFPTETVYGLGANALDARAVAAIFEAKGRPSDNPLIVHISEFNEAHQLCEDITIQAQRVMEAFWPGPLTVILTKKPVVPDTVTAGLNTVALRMPDHPIALAFIRSAGVPVAAPSANTSGKPSPTTAGHVMADLSGRINMVVDGGSCRVGLESTVLDLSLESPVILRPGGVTREALEGVLGHVETYFPAGEDLGLGEDPDQGNAPKSPGMKYTHYAPKAPVIVVTGEDYINISVKVCELVARYRADNKKVGVLASAETARHYCADEVFQVGSRLSLETVGKNLFGGLRSLDEKNVDLIIAEGYPESGIGTAIMNRLKKASGNNIVLV